MGQGKRVKARIYFVTQTIETVEQTNKIIKDLEKSDGFDICQNII